MSGKMKKLAVIFPGIGYTVDKPLLHYSRRLAAEAGYEVRLLPYTGFPEKKPGDTDRIGRSCRIAMEQAQEMLSDLDLAAYEDILFVGKSIGTAVAAELAAEIPVCGRIRFVMYTPLEETVAFPFIEAVVFTGSADPWTGKEKTRIPALCRERGIPCHIIPGANHSLESGVIEEDLRQMQGIMEVTARFIRN